jgi:hypothetical protein
MFCHGSSVPLYSLSKDRKNWPVRIKIDGRLPQGKPFRSHRGQNLLSRIFKGNTRISHADNFLKKSTTMYIHVLHSGRIVKERSWFIISGRSSDLILLKFDGPSAAKKKLSEEKDIVLFSKNTGPGTMANRIKEEHPELFEQYACKGWEMF